MIFRRIFQQFLSIQEKSMGSNTFIIDKNIISKGILLSSTDEKEFKNDTRAIKL